MSQRANWYVVIFCNLSRAEATELQYGFDLNFWLEKLRPSPVYNNRQLFTIHPLRTFLWHQKILFQMEFLFCHDISTLKYNA